MEARSYLVFLTLAILCFQVANISGIKYALSQGKVNDEQQLIDSLLKDYNKKLRPSGTVQIKFALNLNQIIKLIEKDQIFMLNVFIDHEWIDNRLTWNPEEYGNLTVVRISSENLWTPDTFVYTTADHTGFLLPQTGAYFVVSSSGNIFWPNPLTQMRVRCRMGIAWFPFDDQLCVIVFGSWSYTYTYLNYTLINESPSLENYTENNEWTLVGYKPIREEIKYDNWIEDDHFSEIRYKILIRRKPLFVLQNFVIPALMLCIITLVTFFIPFAQEMQLGISIMLAFSVFKLRLSDDVPVQSDSIPLINIYFTGCMSFSLSAMIWFSFMNTWKEKNAVPKCLRTMTEQWIYYLMCTSSIKKDCCSKKGKKCRGKYYNVDRKSVKEVAEDIGGFEPDKMPQTKPAYLLKINSNPGKEIWIPNSDSTDSSRKTSVIAQPDTGTTLNIKMSESFLNYKQLKRTDKISQYPSTINSTENPEQDNLLMQRRPSRLSYIKALKVVDSASNHSLTDSVSKSDASTADTSLSEADIMTILNRFVFFLFLVFIIMLNMVCLVGLPYIIKEPLTMKE